MTTKKGGVPWNKGVPRSKETKEKIRIGNSGEKNPNYGKPAWNHGLNKNNCPSIKNMVKKSRKYRLTQKFKKKDTKIEIALQKELDKREKLYIKHIPVCNICIPDIVFPKKKIAVFADGDYWHSKEFKNGTVWKRDRNQDKVLKENNWVSLRFWEHEINNDVSQCVDTIISTLEDN